MESICNLYWLLLVWKQTIPVRQKIESPHPVIGLHLTKRKDSMGMLQGKPIHGDFAASSHRWPGASFISANQSHQPPCLWPIKGDEEGHTRRSGQTERLRESKAGRRLARRLHYSHCRKHRVTSRHQLQGAANKYTCMGNALRRQAKCNHVQVACLYMCCLK